MSIIVCTLKISNLIPLLKSLNFTNIDGVEIIIVNQSGDDIDDIVTPYLLKFKEVIPQEKLSAPNARNYGATYSEAEYLLFMDDDALFVNMTYTLFDQLINSLKESNYSVHIAQRGEIDSENNFLTHWNNEEDINIRNFPRFIIEWNIIIRKSLFEKIAGFYNIGPGSKHLAQAGEAFILIARVLSLNFKINKLTDILIAHPSLFQIDTIKEKKYLYGAGYAVGHSIHYMTVFNKLYWTLRIFLSSLKKANLSIYRIVGFFDGFMHRLPRAALFSKQL